jgi:ABC-type antimicrobial peptide transport system permease subunit
LSIGLALAAAFRCAHRYPAGIELRCQAVRSFALRTIDTLLAFPGILIAIFIGAMGPGHSAAALGVASHLLLVPRVS